MLRSPREGDGNASRAMTNPFKDLFSGHAEDYAKFRPKYPLELFAYLVEDTPSLELAWDCGTGNGQAAVALAGWFRRVIATDPSAKQIQQATPHPRVEYRVASAEEPRPERFDLICVAQALHWFDHEAFFRVVEDSLKPDGLLALWCYGLCHITPEVDAVIWKLYEEILGNYWEKERSFVEQGYQNIEVPFPEEAPPPFEMRAEWSLDEFAGYLTTWSAQKAYTAKTGQDALELIAPELKAAWRSALTRSLRWPLSLRLFRKPSV